jgi:hypothetical protein
LDSQISQGEAFAEMRDFVVMVEIIEGLNTR